jgi:hypothetical protein
MAKAKGRGGVRPGSGRKPANPEGVTVPVGITVPQVLMERLDALAKRNDWNRSEAITEAIRGLLASAKRGR